jgi:hypothetical protein
MRHHVSAQWLWLLLALHELLHISSWLLMLVVVDINLLQRVLLALLLALLELLHNRSWLLLPIGLGGLSAAHGCLGILPGVVQPTSPVAPTQTTVLDNHCGLCVCCNWCECPHPHTYSWTFNTLPSRTSMTRLFIRTPMYFLALENCPGPRPLSELLFCCFL